MREFFRGMVVLFAISVAGCYTITREITVTSEEDADGRATKRVRVERIYQEWPTPRELRLKYIDS